MNLRLSGDFYLQL